MTILPSTRPHTDAASPPNGEAPGDPLAARLQARVDLLAAQPGDAAPRARVPSPLSGSSSPSDGLAAEVDDLNQQLELLREQLEVAFADIEARIAAADTRTATAEELAASADTRAQVASARAANVLYAVDDLAAELTRIAASSAPDVGRLLTAVDRMKARLQPS